jgi:hypothetical protein
MSDVQPRKRTTRDAPGDQGAAQAEAPEPALSLQHLAEDERMIDAVAAIYRQLGALAVHNAQVEATLDSSAPETAVLAMVGLNSAWALLDARVELLEALSGIGTGREVWMLPAMLKTREASRTVLEQAGGYVVRHGASASAMLAQLRHLSTRLAISDSTGPSVAGTAPFHPPPELDPDPDPLCALRLFGRRSRARCRRQLARPSRQKWARGKVSS